MVLVTSGIACEQVHPIDILISGGDVSGKSHGGLFRKWVV